MKVSFLDLRVEGEERQELLDAIEAVFQHGRLVLGPEVEELENKIAQDCGRKFAVGVNSGTDALLLGLKALGIGPGDEVITTSLSWIATTNAIALTGATPVFADIRDDLNIDPHSVEKLISSRTKAVLPVHYTGKMCDMEALNKIAERRKILIVEDAAQAYGATYRNRKVGSFGVIGCFSMNPMKVFAACGEAGMVVTDNADIRERLISLRYNGTVNREVCVTPSLNGRLDTIQAAVLLKRLLRVPNIIGRRRKIATRYDHLLNGIVATPIIDQISEHVYYTYMIQADRRDELKAFLEAKEIETKIQHPYLMPQQPAYAKNVLGEFENAKRLLPRILCIPAHEKLTDEQVEFVAEAIVGFYR
jgi:dTDP-4-amino-4,6-dideoxygalactose transaminase